MPAFTPIPLGRPIPDSPHAVSCSLPTMRAVRGYEEKDPEITRRLDSGYPRFVVHPFARRLAAHLGAAGQTLWLTSSARMAAELVRHLGPPSGAALFSRDGVNGVSHPESPETGARAKVYLQNIGGFIPSREAERHLVRLGQLAAVNPEETFPGEATAEIRRNLRRAIPGAGDADLLLANSGMNAVYSAFRAVSDLQAARGRTIWVQLGWLYLDTIAILEKFPPTPEDRVHIHDVVALASLERLFAEKGSRIAGVFSEVPTNPLIQTPDVPALAALCRRHGARLILDPSIASAYSVDILRHCDLLATSLTKYTAGEGDILAGLVAVNPAGPDAAELRRSAAERLEPAYAGDLSRLAVEIQTTESLLAIVQRNTAQVAAFLSGHPRVKEVLWALHPASRAHFQAISRSPESVGGLISFTLRGPMEPFYDRLVLPKGPSFGMRTTLICPYMYLAHYDLVGKVPVSPEITASGIDPDLLRLSVGVEPAADIIASLEAALAGA